MRGLQPGELVVIRNPFFDEVLCARTLEALILSMSLRYPHSPSNTFYVLNDTIAVIIELRAENKACRVLTVNGDCAWLSIAWVCEA